MANIKIPVHALDGSSLDLSTFNGPLLVVNVASKCGLTPAVLPALEKLYGTLR